MGPDAFVVESSDDDSGVDPEFVGQVLDALEAARPAEVGAPVSRDAGSVSRVRPRAVTSASRQDRDRGVSGCLAGW